MFVQYMWYVLHCIFSEPGEETILDLPTRFLMMMRDIAAGMEYLENKSFVHRVK